MNPRDPDSPGNQGHPTGGSGGKAGRPHRQHSRAVLISALAAGGVFQLNGWQVQAHGNRSSHAVATLSAITVTPNDYVLLRQSLSSPNAGETRQLVEVTERIRSLRGQALSSPQAQQLITLRETLKDKLRLRASTHQSLEFLRQGDTAAAIAAIEGEGWTERVLGEYLWALLDVAYLGRQGDAFTAEHMQEFVTLAKAATAYSEKALSSLPALGSSPQGAATKERIAEIYHNIASFTLPDDGTVSAADLKFGRQAADRALALRRELQRKPEIMRALWTVGKHQLRAGELAEARKSFQGSLQQATELKDLAGIAWSKSYLAKVTPDPATARRLEADADRLVESGQAQDVSLQFLRLERKK